MTSRAQPMGDGRTSRKTSHKSNTLSRALEKAEIAVQRDRAGNWRGALSSYKSARELLSKARRRTTSDEIAREIDSVSRTYDTRIQQLREAINNEPREDGDASSSSEDATRDSSIDIPRPLRRPTLPASRPNTPQTPTSPYPPRRDSHQYRPLTPECEIKATMERYKTRELPERPPHHHSQRTPRLSLQFFDKVGADDETIEILQQCESGWWTDLIEGNKNKADLRWSLSSDQTLVASPRPLCLKLKESISTSTSASNKKFLLRNSSFSIQQQQTQHQRNGEPESPTDSVCFWSPPATPVRSGFGGGGGVHHHDLACRRKELGV